MSKSRLLASYTAMTVLVGLAGWTTLAEFPLQAEPVVQEAQDIREPEPGNGDAVVGEVDPLVEELNEKLNSVVGEVAGNLAGPDPIEEAAGAAGQEAPVEPGGRGQRSRVGERVAPVVEAYFNVVQSPVEESSPGVVRVQAVAGAGFPGLRLRRTATPAGATPEAPEAIEGEVTVLVTFNGDGEIVDARVSSGPDPLRRQALQTALQQNYGEQFARVLQVIVEFVPPPAPPPSGAVGRGGRGGARSEGQDPE